jgi:hypothetical protein
VPKGGIGADDRCHCFGLIDRAEQSAPHRNIIEG